ncbi:MAG: phosphopantetheine-binding protein [Pseudomonadota bacterium]
MSKDPKTFLYETLEKTLQYHATPTQLEALRNREDLDLDGLALSSLHTVEVQMELEDGLGVDIETEEFEGLTRLSELVTLVASRQ